MGYEKAYKAALQTATQWIKDGCTDKERTCLECVFPELRESEDIMRKAVKEVGLTQHQIDWFKTNVFPPKQGWSEEDEKMLARIIERGQSQIQMFETGLTPEQVSWLKSLRGRPKSSDNWKPSADQMDVLLNTEGMIRASGYPENAKVLASLYKELKKL